MNILIVDDTETNCMVLGAMLRNDGHLVSEAATGEEGVAVFDREQPDLVIMDIMMPLMSGYEATALIKQRAGDRFVPVIFLPGISDEAGLAKCIAHGGDDFLTKPYSQVLLRAKSQALSRIRELHAVVKMQNDALLTARKKDEGERDVARAIFQKILREGCLDHPNLAWRLSPAELLRGDVLLAAPTPHGLLHVMIGDFTGHGLAAAVGAVPVAEAFYSMTQSGYAIGRIAAEINHKLRLILPTNLFCAACLLEWDPSGPRITIWNGGMPDGLVIRTGIGIIRRLHSRHLPLSLLNDEQFDASTDTIEVQTGDRIFLYSDGLIDARNADGEMFGKKRLEQEITRAERIPASLCERIHEAVTRFCEGQAAHDDIALVQLTCDPALSRPADLHTPETPRDTASGNWHIQLALEADALHRVDPLPTLMRTLTEIQDLAQHKQTIFTILAELLANAIDHGLLGLHSSMKNTPRGFAEYYERRERLLAKLRHGHLRIRLEHDRKDTGGRLVIQIHDSGPEFDVHGLVPAIETNQGHSGRGIALVRALCDTLTYHGNGNTVEAVYVWS
jgi:serine phosphatase RsbU (regulator of sigma subunit)/anti-sigma regulatory factor (Ser/Thr protein kinase)